MSDDKDYNKRYQMGEKDKERVTYDIEVFKMGNLSLQKNIDNIEKDYDERNRMVMIDDEESDERYQIGERKEN